MVLESTDYVKQSCGKCQYLTTLLVALVIILRSKLNHAQLSKENEIPSAKERSFASGQNFIVDYTVIRSS